MDAKVDSIWQGMLGRNETPTPADEVILPPAAGPSSGSSNARTTRLTNLPSPKAVGAMIGTSYRILNTFPTIYTNYYQVISLQCERGHLNLQSAGDTCSQCHARLPVFLVNETINLGAGNGNYQAIKELSLSAQNTPVAGILPHYHIFDLEERHYVVTSLPPGARQALPAINELPAGPDVALLWTIELTKALIHIHQRGYLLGIKDNSPNFLENVVVAEGLGAFLANLSSCTPLAQPSPSAFQRDLLFLARVYYTLATGDNQHILHPSAQLDAAPPVVRRVINRARSGGYADARAMLEDLKSAPPPEAPRSLRQNAGYNTDIGQRRDHNEDFVGRYSFGLVQSPNTPEVGLYIVADGMGGHQAGELASQDVVKAVVQHIQDNLNGLQAAPKLKRSTVRLDNVVTPGEVLQQAVQSANLQLHKIRRGTGADRGTTLTAALVVGDTCAVANVGDSRTYLYHNGSLRQITRDHSLVASLLAAGMIQPEEVRSHPQRNQIFRQLGDKPNVEVDIFNLTLTAGDRLLLCSDGLWEMVLDNEIVTILLQAPTPTAACDRLIEAANKAGGDDNISVAVILLE